LRNRAWDVEILGALGIDASMFPVPHPSWAVVGQLRPTLVRKFGLTRSIPVVAGAADSLACALGVGISVPGVVSEMAGSSTCLNSIVDEPLTRLDVTHYPHVVPGGRYVTEVGINTTGEVVDWVADLVYARRRHRASASEFAQLDADAAKVEIGSKGLLFLPVLGDGERDDPTLRGALIGLSLRHGPSQSARAALEGVALAIRERLSMLEAPGSPISELRVSGGDTRLRTWNQVKADATGVSVVIVPGDAAATGVAMLAGLGGGAYADAEQAIRRASAAGETFEPSASARAAYDDLYRRYLDLRQSATVRDRG
jgi:sugar (pentulose or hexulose) kinase